MQAKINSRGQIIIPKKLREKYGLDKGAEVEFLADGDGIRMVKSDAGKLADLKGKLPATRPYPGTAEIRREVGKLMGARLEAEGD